MTIYSYFRLSMRTFKVVLIYEQECFIRYKTRGAAERITSDKARIASILNGLKKQSILYPSCQFVCERIFNVDVVYAKQMFCECKSTCVFSDIKPRYGCDYLCVFRR